MKLKIISRTGKNWEIECKCEITDASGGVVAMEAAVKELGETEMKGCFSSWEIGYDYFGKRDTWFKNDERKWGRLCSVGGEYLVFKSEDEAGEAKVGDPVHVVINTYHW